MLPGGRPRPDQHGVAGWRVLGPQLRDRVFDPQPIAGGRADRGLPPLVPGRRGGRRVALIKGHGVWPRFATNWAIVTRAATPISTSSGLVVRAEPRPSITPRVSVLLEPVEPAEDGIGPLGERLIVA